MDRDGGVGVVLVGGLFHRRELASQLNCERSDDACLLVQAYRKWGVSFPNLLDGEFSFALWDSELGRVLLACSPGQSFPLFYTQRGEDLYFASELRSLLTVLPGVPALSEGYIARWLSLTFSGSASTFFEGVFRILPGSLLIFENGSIRHEEYWRPEAVAPLRLHDSREYADGLRHVLQQAIENRLPDGCGVGAFMSGGLDSTTVTALTAEALLPRGRRMFAFTAVPGHSMDDVAGRFCDEGPNAASVAAMWPNIDHVLIQHGRHSLFFLMDLFSCAQMEPTFNSANYDWIYEIGMQARCRQLDVLFCGDSGNFSISYDGRLALHKLASEGQWQRCFQLALAMHGAGSRRCRGIAYEMLGPWIPLRLRGWIDAVKRRPTALSSMSLIRLDFAQRHGLDDLAFLGDAMRFDASRLRTRFLRRADPAAAKEAFRRVTGVARLDPTCDRRVVEFCLSVPVEYYCENGVPRSLIRNAMAGRLPEAVRTEGRRGLQTADYSNHFHKERAEAFAELERLKRSELAVRALNLDEMERMLHCTDAQIAAQQGAFLFWPKLLRALSLGRFVRRHEEGSLFAAQPGLDHQPCAVASP